MIVGVDGTAVVLDARTCAWLEKHAGLSSLRACVRGTDPHISRQLEEMRFAAMSWRDSATGTGDDTKPGPATESSQWLSTGEAAESAEVISRAIRKAIAEARLPATQIGGRYRIIREDLEHYRAAQAA